MKRIITGLVAGSFILASLSLVGSASAEPVKLTKKQMASITAGDNPHTQLNPGGQPGGCPSNPNCTTQTGNPHTSQNPTGNPH
jgi:hypothetical protein